MDALIILEKTKAVQHLGKPATNVISQAILQFVAKPIIIIIIYRLILRNYQYKNFQLRITIKC